MVSTYLLVSLAAASFAQTDTWRFAVSGDSRNCGDVVMPAIAEKAAAEGPQFYWHLGDFRALYKIDEDIEHAPAFKANPLKFSQYREMAWDDFEDNQLAPFGALQVYLGIGNHELVAPSTRAEYDERFGRWLDGPGVLDRHGAYYHWTRGGVDFITLDNASKEQFDDAQLAWFETLLARDLQDPRIRTIVTGMHEALPGSISSGHSMEQSARGVESGRRVYEALVKAQAAGKRVYILASHSHFFMEGIFNTPYWRKRNAVLPGWIVGTAGAVRYALPEAAKDAVQAQTKVYGYLLGEVSPDGAIDFKFRKLAVGDVPQAVAGRYGADFTRWCFEQNAN